MELTVHWLLFQGQRGHIILMDLLRNGTYGTLASISRAAWPDQPDGSVEEWNLRYTGVYFKGSVAILS